MKKIKGPRIVGSFLYRNVNISYFMHFFNTGRQDIPIKTPIFYYAFYYVIIYHPLPLNISVYHMSFRILSVLFTLYFR